MCEYSDDVKELEFLILDELRRLQGDYPDTDFKGYIKKAKDVIENKNYVISEMIEVLRTLESL